MQKRGLLNRLFGGRLQKLMNHSWQMYPLGLLFGLGFDTASEVGLLAMTAGASAGNLPVPAVLCLPVLFAAGMTVMDTTDGVLMSKAYNWAFLNPLRKIFYNLTTTGLSVAVALLIGTIELLQVLIGMLDLHGPFFDFITGLNFGMLGYVIVAMFLLAWALSVAFWKFGRIEQRYSLQMGPTHICMSTRMVANTRMIICTRTSNNPAGFCTMRRVKWAYLGLLLTGVFVTPLAGRADTVASLLGNFTINQFCGLRLANTAVQVHYVVVFGQLPALRELHLADADGDGVTSQAERDAYIGKLAPGFADGLAVRVDGVEVPLRAAHWTSSLPTEQGGFSLRIDVDFAGILPVAATDSTRTLEFANQNYAGRMGWHEIVVKPASGVQIFDTDAYSTSLTGGLGEALQSVPAAGPLDERTVHLSFGDSAPLDAKPLSGRPGSGGPAVSSTPPASSGKAVVKSGANGSRIAPGSWWTRYRDRTCSLELRCWRSWGAAIGRGACVVARSWQDHRRRLFDRLPRYAATCPISGPNSHHHPHAGRVRFGIRNAVCLALCRPQAPVSDFEPDISGTRVGNGHHALDSARTQRTPGTGGGAFRPTEDISIRGGRGGYTRRSAWPHLRSRFVIVEPQCTRTAGGRCIHTCRPVRQGEKITWRSLLTLGISGGLVPCPSAMVLLLAAVALNKTAYGMLLVVAFSVGLAITLTLVGLAFLYARNRFRRPGTGNSWAHLLPVASACTIMVLGVALCVGALRSFSS